MLSAQDKSQIVELLQNELDGVQSIYVFGSQASGDARDDSDIDLAVYTGKMIPNELVWNCKFKIAELTNKEVDLVDLSSVSTVLQFQVISSGVQLFAVDENIEWFESKVYWLYLTLNEDRQHILDDIAKSGNVYE